MHNLKYFFLICLLIAGCAQSPRSKLAEDSKLIRENEQRLASLEDSVTALNTQIAQLNNRVYEVRTKSGQKTSMTVVPINKPAPIAAAPAVSTQAETLPGVEPDKPAEAAAPLVVTPTPAAAAAVTPATSPARQPTGRKIDPAKKPGPLPAQAAPAVAKAPAAKPASGSIGRPEAGASGQIVPASDSLALPPADLPDNSVPPVPQGNVTSQLPLEEPPAIPVPVLPATDLSLPPEQTSEATPAQTPAAQPQTPAARPRATAKTAAQGEQAAYNTALNAARSGRTTEGIRLFRDFLQKYPNGPYAANAEYWIGECLYSQGKYQDALSEFQAVNTSYPGHHKNADALLKAGITMSKMGDKEGAAEKFRTLIANFPNSEAARRARAMGAH